MADNTEVKFREVWSKIFGSTFSDLSVEISLMRAV